MYLNTSLLHGSRRWLLQYALAFATTDSMHTISSKSILFKIDVSMHLQVSPVPNIICVSVVCVLVLDNEYPF